MDADFSGDLQDGVLHGGIHIALGTLFFRDGRTHVPACVDLFDGIEFSHGDEAQKVADAGTGPQPHDGGDAGFLSLGVHDQHVQGGFPIVADVEVVLPAFDGHAKHRWTEFEEGTHCIDDDVHIQHGLSQRLFVHHVEAESFGFGPERGSEILSR